MAHRDTHVRVGAARGQLLEDGLGSREEQQLTVVDVATELCDTAFCYPVLQAHTQLPLPREGTEEIFWLARDRYFPVHRYPPKVRDDGLEREEGEDEDSDSE